MENKRYYWIKLKTDFFNQDTIDFLLSQNNGCEYVVLYQMLCLKTANTNGFLVTNINEIIVPYDVNKIARDTKYFSEDTIRVALELYKQLGLIYEEENNLLRIFEIEKMVGTESANREAIKKREQRLKKKIEQGTLEGTKCLIEYRDKSIDIRDIDIIDNKKEINKEKGSCYYAEQQWKRLLNGTEIQAFNDFDDTFGVDQVKQAIDISCMQNKCTASYVKGILNKQPRKPSWLGKEIKKQETTKEEQEELDKLLEEFK